MLTRFQSRGHTKMTAPAAIFVQIGGAVGELPPESETPNPHFLQAQFRFCLRQARFSKPEFRLPQLL
jgi:hypothetical protein